MAILYPVFAQSSGEITLETIAFAPNLHKVYLNAGFGENLVLNADGDNTTDWVVSGATQVGDMWSYVVGAVPSIITGVSGFSNRAQKMTAGTGYGDISLYSNNINITGTNGKKYRMWMQYRSSHQITVYQIFQLPGNGISILIAPANTGTAASVVEEHPYLHNDLYKLLVRISGGGETGSNVWFEIDKLMLKEAF